jgi:uncharacterized iron-regulated protein
LEEQARSARLAGDLDEAERLSAQLDNYRRLDGSGVRGPLVTDLATATDDEFADLVADGTIYLEGGKFNTRYFQTDPVPGGGVLVYDFFIARDRSESSWTATIATTPTRSPSRSRVRASS